MEHKAGKALEEEIKRQTEETKLKIRKEKINKKLFEKRHSLPTNQTRPHQKMVKESEEIEVEEEAGKIGHQNLAKHRKKYRKSKKRCWYCKNPGHFKESCPFIRCFWCHKLGHTKAKCFIRISMELYKRLEHIERKKEHKKKVKMKREKEHRESTGIYKERLKTSNFIKQDGKWKLECECKTIGDYLGISEPINLEDLRRSTIKWKYVDKKIQKDIPIASVPLKDKFDNLCGCGKYLRKNEFISHVWVKHKGKVPASSFINQPPWIYNVLFDSDELEMLYCRTNESLS